MTEAVVLVAGRGSRLQELTEDRPKCLIEIGGKPIINWILGALRRNGLTGITLVGGYRADLLPVEGVAKRLNVRWEETNMVATLLCADDILRAHPTIVSYGDILYAPTAIQSLLCAREDIAITYDRAWLELWQARFTDPLDDAETFHEEGGLLRAIGSRASSVNDIHGQYMGLLRFTPAGWLRVRAVLDTQSQARIDRLDMTSLLSLLLAHGERIAAIPVDGGWLEVDNQTDLSLARRIAASPPGTFHHDWRAA
ncbi:MAG: phosphocholine cytidylyltransferase family protein [Pseudomonadales bacterium]|nr:phosphocholine cytidylyltransferase family protein [Pseudomonadales bacterium]MCP5184425.1 phosphocholine cytidylyltransferase family protein [Pseudomonadales bacterium]